MTEMEKTEKATSYKLEKARKQGQVSKSSELNALIGLGLSLVVLASVWQSDSAVVNNLFRQILTASAHFRFSLDTIMHLQKKILFCFLSVWTPLALLLCIAISAANIFQTGFVCSLQALLPDSKRLNIVAGLKRFFSVRLFFETGKQFLKLLLVCTVLTMIFRRLIPSFLKLQQQHPLQYPALLMRLLLSTGWYVVLVLALFACADFIFVRWKYAKDQRMSKHEVREEYKQREGDPKIKSKIKQLQRELRARSSSLQHIKHADVLITNPTHLAIALQYKPGMPAPKVLCKVSGELVKAAKKEARRYAIRIIENKVFARALFQQVSLNQYIDEKFFPVAAIIFTRILEEKCKS